MKKLSVVIPCYNEAENIEALLEKCAQAINGKDIELILVDNNSKDKTAQILTQLAPRYPFMRWITEKNQGYGNAVLAGLKVSEGEYIGWTHADLQTPPSDIVKALSIIETSDGDKKIYVKGNRQGRKLFDQFFTIGMGLFESVFLGTWLWDINGQPNIFHRSFWQTWRNPPGDFALDLYALYIAKKMKLKIKRFDVVFPPRVAGVSSWNTGLGAKWKFIKRTVSFSRNMKKTINAGQ